MIQWVIKYSGGLIQSRKQATYAIFGFVAATIVITIILVAMTGSSQPTQGPVPVNQLVP